MSTQWAECVRGYYGNGAGVETSVDTSQGPHLQILMTGGGGGGSDRGSYFIPKKITTSEFVYPKKLLLFVTYPKKSLSSFFATPKIPPFFFATQKNPGVFHRPKKNHLWPKFQTQKNHSDPPSLKYVSGAPGRHVLSREC